MVFERGSVMEDLKAKWAALDSTTKAVVGVGAAFFGVLFTFKILPLLIAGIGAIGFFLVFIIPYWVPTIIAFRRKHESRSAIAVVNFFFGWTFIGWILAFIWAMGKTTSQNVALRTVVVQNYASSHTAQPPPPPPPIYKVGDIVNGHRFNGTSWEPIAGGEASS